MLKFLKSFFSSSSVEKNSFTSVNKTSFASGISNKTAQIIDVRTPAEYKSGSIKKAKLINVMAIDFNSKLETLNKEQPLYVYCKSGVRSKRASKRAIKLGFTEVYDLIGGYDAWK